MKSTFTKIGDSISRVLTRERVCESCGNEFSCGASLKGCWCSELNLSDETRSQLRGLYQDCLCRECLEKVSAKEATAPHQK